MMKRGRFFYFIDLRSIVSAMVRDFVDAFLASIMRFLQSAIAEPLRPLPTMTRNDLGGARLAYVGPTIDLRHEAGRRSLAAARGI